MFTSTWARRAAGRAPAVPKRSFFLESEPMPDVLPGQGFAPRPPLVTEQQVTPPPPVAPAEEQADWERYLSFREGAMRSTVSLLAATPGYGTLTGPTPIADDLRRDWELLEAANGRLVRRVRLLEGQLRALGVEPVPRE